ncbi:putative protease [Actinacidiphila reveromycinica]|uniref:Putative protease n=1 Tax=Actinacidiphila reveromycinica TaxID=659352 RepID=A0A7U3UUS2_9ACTN|nr:S53 family peptidase [Streptomyces sp. SN-593]BBA98991.1 putative protease [Streptomyces sp. SN-593]
MQLRSRARLLSIGVAALAAIPLTILGPAAASDAASGSTHATARSCATAAPGHAACAALVRTDIVATKTVAPNATPSGYGPSSLQSAYKLPSSTAGSGRTVAIVDAYDDPTAEADLAVYRSQFGLPACTTANGCFKKIDQNGGTSYPAKDGGWGQEISLDIDMVSAVCPNCHILLVEAKSASFADLGASVNRAAATSGVVAISNSYGGSDASDASYGSYYNHPGIAVTASSGDSGYGASYPASSHYVTAVGGTTLSTASNTRGWTETAWSGAGSGCSAYNTALTSASSFGTGCSKRAEADVSAVANPSTGVAVYDSTAYQGYVGWMVFGGTSVSSPIIASVYGLAGNTASIDNNYPYTHSGSLFDVTSGSNGSCSTSQWCTARVGWDGPTGLGTPNGVGAF